MLGFKKCTNTDFNQFQAKKIQLAQYLNFDPSRLTPLHILDYLVLSYSMPDIHCEILTNVGHPNSNSLLK